MLLLRIINQGRWAADRSADDPSHVEDAARDLRLDSDQSGLSVYRTEGGEDSREIALRFAMTCRRDPRHADYTARGPD